MPVLSTGIRTEKSPLRAADSTRNSSLVSSVSVSAVAAMCDLLYLGMTTKPTAEP